MITEEIRKFIEAVPVAIVASTNEAGYPHLAAATDLKVENEVSLVFDNWFCATTLSNVSKNPKIAIAVTTSYAQTGYQIIGEVRRSFEEAILDGYVPGIEKPGTPQALVQMKVAVEKVMEFSAGAHSDFTLD